jgi:hypothetical protein
MAKKKISLLAKKPIEATAGGRVVQWLTSSGRAILVVTELVVLMAFISRFWLDTKNNDLGEIVRQKRIILESSQPFEKDFLALQSRISSAGNFINEYEELGLYLKIITDNLPRDVVIEQFSLSKATDIPKGSLAVNIMSEESLALFLNRLSKDERIIKIRIGKIERSKLAEGTKISIGLDFTDISKQSNEQTSES